MTELTRDKFLGGAVEAWQPRVGFRSASDAVLLAAAVPAKSGQTVLDLGCGVGVAALCLASRTGAVPTGVEIEPLYAALAARNGLDVTQADIAALPAEIRARSFDHVMFNPPYYAPNRGSDAQTVHRAAAMREKLPLTLWLDAAVRRTTLGGTVTAILGADRVPDILAACDQRLGRIFIRPLSARAKTPAKRIIFQATKGARSPFTLLPPLILHTGSHHLVEGDDASDDAVNILRRGVKMPIHEAASDKDK